MIDVGGTKISITVGALIATILYIIGQTAYFSSLITELKLNQQKPIVTREEYANLNTNVVNLSNRFSSMETKMDKIIDQLIKKD